MFHQPPPRINIKEANMLKQPVAGMGDSNLRFNGYGWAGALAEHGLYEGDILNMPGGSTANALHALRHVPWPTREGPVLVTFGINDMIQGIGPIEFCKNHLKIKREFERAAGEREWVWMPSHYTGHWKLEVLRYALRITAWWHGITFVNLRKHSKQMEFFYNSSIDPWHLNHVGYETLTYQVVHDG